MRRSGEGGDEHDGGEEDPRADQSALSTDERADGESSSDHEQRRGDGARQGRTGHAQPAEQPDRTGSDECDAERRRSQPRGCRGVECGGRSA